MIFATYTLPYQTHAEHNLKAKIGRYNIEIQLPDGGVFSGEELDLEFRISDPTQKDPVEGGEKGVIGAEIKARITMPAMEGMPASIPSIHREGVPGFYGMVAYFPHGGDYRIDMAITLKDGAKHTAKFLISVKDARPSGAAKSPFTLSTETSKPARSGVPTELQMKVIDTKSQKPITDFDIAHEQRFHLLIVSRDLNWFVHEHPTLSPDGTWRKSIRFPAGGEYLVFGDVAPSGKGSRILRSTLNVSGPKPKWAPTFRPSLLGQEGGLQGKLRISKIPIGRMTTLRVDLFDAKSNRVVKDTQNWLGAAGHLMIFHTDGTTVVHSHPKDGQPKNGKIEFSARFPKAGLYKAYAQFQWHGQIRTIPFGIKVTE